MIKIEGITEFIGESSVGKTHLALWASNSLRTLYISNSLFRHRLNNENFNILKFDNFLELKIFITNELQEVVKNNEIELLIIDTLESFLYYNDLKPLGLHSEIFNIMKKLKRLFFKKGLKTIIINNSYKTRKITYFNLNNSILGFSWCYHPNLRYLLMKLNDDKRCIKQIKGGNIYKEFHINNNGIVFDEK